MIQIETQTLAQWQAERDAGLAPTRPVVIRGLVAHWPLVQAAQRSPREAAQMLRHLASPAPVDVMLGDPAIKGRFFYSADMTGFNFTTTKLPLPKVVDRIEAVAQDPNPPAVYAGSASIPDHAARLIQTHPLPIRTDGTPRIWVGNATQVAIHYDVPDNIAAVAVGRRRFTLFPPKATPYLYVGPLGFTIAGQPVCMVDPTAPDLARYPLYPQAEAMKLVADLAPGDAIFIPSLWWHHVQAFDPFNVLVNYWHNETPIGQPFAALVHAMLALRDLSADQRASWQCWFDHFVFSEAAPHAADHIPPHARGVQGPASPERQAAIRDFLMARLSRL